MMYYCARTFKENLNKTNKDIISKEPKLSKLTLIFEEEKKYLKNIKMKFQINIYKTWKMKNQY